MNVSVLQQFLQNLIPPLEASTVSPQTISGLNRACQGFEPFRDKDVSEFAEFLTRAADYERDGKWPNFNPPLAGRIVDEPSARDYAHRLRTFLEREVPSGSPISNDVRSELLRLEKQLKLKGVKEVAKELQIEDGFTKAKQGIDKIVLHLTGQNPSEKKTKTTTDPAAIQRHAAELRSLTGSDGLEQRLKELTKNLSAADLGKLAKSLGASTGKSRAKAELSKIILSALTSSQSNGTRAATESGENEPSSSGDSKIAQWAEIVEALKAKADGPGAPHDEIEAELRSLEGQMDRDEAIAVAKRIGIVRHLNTRNEAFEEIRRKVFETKRARESIAY